MSDTKFVSEADLDWLRDNIRFLDGKLSQFSGLEFWQASRAVSNLYDFAYSLENNNLKGYGRTRPEDEPNRSRA
jgi:aminoglycoside phosphotransferase family enzyme